MGYGARNEDLSLAQKQELTELLHSKRHELMNRLKLRRNEPDIQVGPGDEADIANEDSESFLEISLMDREAKLLREVERALAKIERGEYGRCEGTGEPIGFARLKLRPWTRYSVTFKEELEKESLQPGEVQHVCL